jgi:ribonucleoside-diphosphate reductase alpha chain
MARKKLSDTRESITHKVEIGGFSLYIIIGLYDDLTPGELFVKVGKEGSTISGLLDSFATLFSMSLQNGVPLEALIKKFKDTRFEPAGFTDFSEIPQCTSLVDYIVRYLEYKFILTKPA